MNTNYILENKKNPILINIYNRDKVIISKVYFNYYNIKVGGDDEISLDDIINIKTDTLETVEPVIQKELSKEIYAATQLYAFDTIFDFKKKIALITGIQPYKQHLWSNKGGILNYMVYINDKLDKPFIFTDTDKYIHNIPVFVKYDKQKDAIKIIANDENVILNDFFSQGFYEFNLISLDEFIIPKNTRLSDIESNLVYYGFIHVFYPMITINIWKQFLSDINEFEKYNPRITISKYTKKKINNEILITDKAIEVINSKNIKSISKMMYISIIYSVVSNFSYIHSNTHVVNIRNIFDLIQTSDEIMVVKANIFYNKRNYILNKTYKNYKIIDKLPAYNSIVLLIKEPTANEELIELTIFMNGNYSISAKWKEENLYGFDDIFKILCKKINKLIDMLNTYTEAFYGIHRLYKLTPLNFKINELCMSIIYRKNVKYEDFQALKLILETLVEGNIIKYSTNENDNTNIIQYNFKKGMYSFNPTRIEKNIVLSNYYSYLVDKNIFERWSRLFYNTHSLKVIYSQGNIRITIDSLKDYEFYIFYTYIMYVFNELINNVDNYIKNVNDIKQYKKNKQITNLKNIDPLLYNFRDKNNPLLIYSKICQKPFQPIVINADQYDEMDTEEKKTATKYWNFTKKQEIYYKCPNPKYPYINFIIDSHPKGYCVPCCKITNPNAPDVSAIKKAIHNTCMESHKYDKKKEKNIKDSKYIMVYGKPIEEGRIMIVPEDTLKPLFKNINMINVEKNTSLSEEDYYIIGVSNTYNGRAYMSILNILSQALEKTPEEILKDVVLFLKKQDYFGVLMNGNIYKYFLTKNDLIKSITNLHELPLLEDVNVPWNDIFIDISFYLYNILVVVFNDKSTKQIENFDILLNSNMRKCEIITKKKILIVIKKKKCYHPIYKLVPSLYFKNKVISIKIFEGIDTIGSVLCDIISYNIEKTNIHDYFDLDSIEKFCAENTKYSIHSLFINKYNKCYYVGLNNNAKMLYIPVVYSNYNTTKSDIVLHPYNTVKYGNPFKLLNSFILDYNGWVNDINSSKIIRLEKWSMTKNKEVFGFVSKGLNFYHDVIKYEDALKLSKDTPFVEFLYSPFDINKLICSKTEHTNDIRKQNITFDIYSIYIQQLFTLEFLLYVFNKNNTSLRQKIIKSLTANKDTSYKNITSIIHDFYSDIKKKFSPDAVEKIVEYDEMAEDDMQKITLELNTFNVDIIKNHFKELKFNFDDDILMNMHLMDSDELKKYLLIESKNFVSISKFDDIKKHLKDKNVFNMISSCDGVDKTYCKNNKLLITKEQLNSSINIVVNDIHDPIKYRWMTNYIFIPSVIQYFKFKKNENEKIIISSKA